MTDAERQQQKVREFFQLLPLTLDLAGLPKSEAGRFLSPEQIEIRAITIRNAYKVARQVVMEVANQQ
jgi:hypothetical protein